MNTKDKIFLQETKEYNDKIMAEIQSYLFPAFEGLTFGTPDCDLFDSNEVILSGKIFQEGNVHYDYKILFYPDDDEVRVDIARYQNGALTRIGFSSSSSDFWTIEGKNLSSKDIADKKRLLDAKLK